MKIIFFILVIVIFANSKNFYLNYKQEKVSFSSLESNSTSIKYYKNERRDTVGVTNEILIIFDSDTPLILEIMKKYPLELEKKLDETIYLFSIEDRKNLFSVVSQLNLEKEVKYAEPNFIKKREFR